MSPVLVGDGAVLQKLFAGTEMVLEIAFLFRAAFAECIPTCCFTWRRIKGK